MKIAYTSDTHLGLTKESSIRKVFKGMAKEEPDLIIHAGDYCGGFDGAKSVRSTIKLLRYIMPTTPVLTVLGNHEYWCSAKYKTRDKSIPSTEFYSNMYEINNVFLEYNINWLDTINLYQHPDFPTVKFIGHTGWYTNPNPPTNDIANMPPYIDGDTNKFLYKKAIKNLDKGIVRLSESYNKDTDTVVFLSHFPVINPGNKQDFHLFNWSEQIGELMQKEFNCRYFICGHAHQSHDGPLRYEAGSDYYNPKYKILII